MNNYFPVKKPSALSKDRKERQLAGVLRAYTRKDSTSYDPEFDAEIRALQPGWFRLTRPKTPSAETKKMLLEMARNKARKPSQHSKDDKERRLGCALNSYLNKTKNHDPEFSTKIRSLCPEWFENLTVIFKTRLLELASSGANRPNKESDDEDEKRLGRALSGYTNEKSNGYDKEFDCRIRALRKDWFESTAARCKAELLEMALNGDEKPKYNDDDIAERRLADKLRSYTDERDKCYDRDFDERIRDLRPDWFIDALIIRKTHKAILLRMAREGSKRPINGSGRDERRLALALWRYTNRNGEEYDHDFDIQIRKLCPDWFISTADANRAKLLDLARNGAKRPHHSQKISSSLVAYTNKKSSSYNQDFDKQIRALRPDWFERASAETKRILLKLAKSGADRPTKRTSKLGDSLYQSTHKGTCYDQKFDKLVRTLRPDWFTSITKENRKQLLELAKSGADKPGRDSRLYASFHNHTMQSLRHTDFNEQLRALRPDWFIDKVAEGQRVCKNQLVDLAKSGAKRPSSVSKNPEERRLGSALGRYTRKSLASYDKDFDKQIRRLRPDWFK